MYCEACCDSFPNIFMDHFLNPRNKGFGPTALKNAIRNYYSKIEDLK